MGYEKRKRVRIQKNIDSDLEKLRKFSEGSWNIALSNVSPEELDDMIEDIYD